MVRTTRAGQLVERGRMVPVEAPVEPLRDGALLVRTRFASGLAGCAARAAA